MSYHEGIITASKAYKTPRFSVRIFNRHDPEGYFADSVEIVWDTGRQMKTIAHVSRKNRSDREAVSYAAMIAREAFWRECNLRNINQD